ncbi:hypothetical protein DEO72_LG8g1482 [Vigna unguiculata]|uniref:Uncharacterized protein n=1 Tax=Vigna unguiculata TaxID=3917 RepID=A0A4D6MQX4_VIGUN|nr:hypothetical protein DEO72_LG8g1482 [Vigna unguiculata]
MASSSSSRKRIKRMTTKQRDPNIDGWISDPEAQENFNGSFRSRKIINHKHFELPFFRNHGFAFLKLLSSQHLETFVQLTGDIYPDLVRVFYANLACEEDLLTSRVKGVNIVLTLDVWTSIIVFRIAGIPAHRGFPGANRLDIYQGCLRDPTTKRDYSIFLAGGMKKDERVLAFLTAWILVPRNGNHAQLTTEDVFLLHAFKSNVLVDWSEVVSNTMQKAIKLPNYPMPYAVFVCKVLEHYKVNFSGKASYTPNHTSLIGANVLHHMGMSFQGTTWRFKDEPDEDPVDAADASSSATRTHYEQEMLRMVTALFDQHQT